MSQRTQSAIRSLHSCREVCEGCWERLLSPTEIHCSDCDMPSDAAMRPLVSSALQGRSVPCIGLG